MAFVLYNTLTRRKEPFIPLEDNIVRMYACGPTVYNYPHIGNYRTFLFEDVLNKYLRYKKYDVTFIMNITDVDDKTIRGAKEAHTSLSVFTKKYTQLFLEELETLNIQLPDRLPRATEHIPQMLELVQGLLDKNFAYESDGSIYFRVGAMADYGKLAQLDRRQLKAGASQRVLTDEYDKENVSDFVLWKGYQKEDGEVFWCSDTESIKKGRPGWHLECSTMSMQYLGSTFDIHCGAVDLIFPHHTNEIAQSECFTGKPYVRYWIHGEHLNMGEKMSKSLGNVIYLKDLIKKGYDPLVIRMALLSAHYRSPLEFHKDMLDQAQSNFRMFHDFFQRMKQIPQDRPTNPLLSEALEHALQQFQASMDDDLNLPQAWAVLHSLVGSFNKQQDAIGLENAEQVLSFFQECNAVLGVFRFEEALLDEEIEQLIHERQEARKSKNFQRADAIRDELKAQGIALEDTKDGVRWKREV